jgi:hypothetical protein
MSMPAGFLISLVILDLVSAKTESIDRAKIFIFDGLASEILSAKIDRVFFGLDEYAAAHPYTEAN